MTTTDDDWPTGSIPASVASAFHAEVVDDHPTWGSHGIAINSNNGRYEPEPGLNDPPETREAERAIRAQQQLNAETSRQLVQLRARRAAEQQLTHEVAEEAKKAAAEGSRIQEGGAFLLDVPPTPPALWGKGDEILWAHGEALMLVGPQGVGKTTLMGQLIRASLGLVTDVLGYPVAPATNRIGYLAMDRPQQAARALGRMFHPEEREFLNECLRVWTGPPPADVAADPATLVRIAELLDSETLFIDSVKDAAIGLSKDEVGAGYNRARQMALAEGIQILESHHMVKSSADGKVPRYLKDVYGSTWLTSGAGSVVILWGDAGDPVVEFVHLKQPMAEVGPFKVLHNRETGRPEVFHDEDTDVVALARRCASTGLSAKEAAGCIYGTEKPTHAQVEKARRRLGEYVDKGLLVHRPGASASGPGSAARWFPQVSSEWLETHEERYR